MLRRRKKDPFAGLKAIALATTGRRLGEPIILEGNPVLVQVLAGNESLARELAIKQGLELHISHPAYAENILKGCRITAHQIRSQARDGGFTIRIDGDRAIIS